jgi:YEATS domain-containing protein 4
MKGVQISRPFIYGTTARPFDDKTNPRPPDAPDSHTHSWQVFVKGVDDTDITYWLRRVQFKLHESIPNHVRSAFSPRRRSHPYRRYESLATSSRCRLAPPQTPLPTATYTPCTDSLSSTETVIEGEKGKPFVVNETGWGEFEITLKLYYATESGEKAQTLYHHLHLHPYGKTDEEKARSRRAGGEVVAWNYEEQLFNEPYEAFFSILTSGAHLPKGPGNNKGSNKAAAAPDPNAGLVYERSALVPTRMSLEQPFSKQTEELELKRIQDALGRVMGLVEKTKAANADKEKKLAELRAENAAAAGDAPARAGKAGT